MFDLLLIAVLLRSQVPLVKAAIAGRSQGIFSEPSRFLHRSGNSVQASPSTASHP
jgi:hypothetical protein